MQRPLHKLPQPDSAARSRLPGEAARYGVLRRLAPALKHDMVVHLQAVSMMAEVLGARLEKNLPPQAEFQRHVSKMNRLAREAVLACLRVTAWIEPAEEEGVALHEGVAECLALLQSNLGFRGFTITSQVPESGFEVSRSLLRNLLAACLIHLTDRAVAACAVMVEGEMAGASALLTLRCVPADGTAEPVPYEAGYRELDWADIQALADAEGVALTREAEHIELRLPRLVAASALQIVPL